MNVLFVKYISDQQTAEISTDSSNSAWVEIRRAYEERTEELINISPMVFTVPWWIFLSCRKSLKYLVDKHSINLNLSSDVTALLKKALENETIYKTSLQSSLPNQDIEST